MVRFKEGVRGYCKTGCVRPVTWVVIEFAEVIFRNIGKECVVTSLCDGKHSRHSKHYEGNAVDFRTRHLTDDEKLSVVARFKQLLSKEYDIILESTHLHIEYDPKE